MTKQIVSTKRAHHTEFRFEDKSESTNGDCVTPCCQQNGSTAQNVDSMGIPKSTNGDIQNYRNNIWCSETSEPNQQIC